MRPSTNGVSKQHPEVCCGLQRQTASPPHPRKLSWIGVHTRCNLVTTWCAAPRESALALLAALLPHSTEYHVVVYLLEAFHAPCVLPARLLTGHISISDHGLRVQMEALILNAAATVCSPRPTGDYRQAALGLVRCNAIRAPQPRTRTASNGTLLAAPHSTHCTTAHLNPILPQGFVEARALSNNQATSYCNATPPNQNVHKHT